MKCIKSPLQVKAELRHHFELMGLKSSAGIAKLTGINQSQVYRNLYENSKRLTATLRKLCNYAGIELDTAVIDPRDSSILMEALSVVWDGSDLHAKRLAELLLAHRNACL